MIFHASCLAENYSSTSDVNIVARSADTDKLIITIGCFQKLPEKNQNLRLWLEMGTETKKNTLRYVSGNQIYSPLCCVSYFLQRYQLSIPCLAVTMQQHSLEKVKFALSNVYEIAKKLNVLSQI